MNINLSENINKTEFFDYHSKLESIEKSQISGKLKIFNITVDVDSYNNNNNKKKLTEEKKKNTKIITSKENIKINKRKTSNFFDVPIKKVKFYKKILLNYTLLN
jgi:hypothetical protein